MIFGTLPGGNILYAEPQTDVTEKFLKYIEKKQGKPAEKSAAPAAAAPAETPADAPKVSLKNEEPAPVKP